MPPSMGGTSFPKERGQSEMAREASLLVTRAPATTSTRVHNTVTTAKRRSPGEGISTFWRSRAKWDRPPGRSWTGQQVCPTCLPLDGEIQGLAVFGADGDRLFLRAVLFVHNLDGIRARRQALQRERAVIARHREEGMAHHSDIRAHPRMDVALHGHQHFLAREAVHDVGAARGLRLVKVRIVSR